MPETQEHRAVDRILERIVATKHDEIEALRPHAEALRVRAESAPAPRDFAGALAPPSHLSVIAEVKRRSPGAGTIRGDLDPVAQARAYAQGGAAALSVLTDGPYFGGSLEDLAEVRAAVSVPCLRKDFVLDELQLWEARAAGADAVLLIVRILEDGPLLRLREEAEALGMAVLVEAHDRTEVERALTSGARILGINNRDLSDFTTDLGVTLAMLESVPADVLLVSESGIRTAEDARALADEGVDGILVGEALVRAPDPMALARALRVPRRRDRRGGGARAG